MEYSTKMILLITSFRKLSISPEVDMKAAELVWQVDELLICAGAGIESAQVSGYSIWLRILGGYIALEQEGLTFIDVVDRYLIFLGFYIL